MVYEVAERPTENMRYEVIEKNHPDQCYTQQAGI